MFYKQYLTREEWDRIVNTDYGADTVPHCDASTFHAPGSCPYCDGYYRQHPDKYEITYATAEANGWGGNQAPILDDVLATMERAETERVFDQVGEQIGKPFEFNLDRIDSMKSNAMGWRWLASQVIPCRFQSTFWTDGEPGQSTSSWWQWRDRIWGERKTFIP